jgi:hypothetical protein
VKSRKLQRAINVARDFADHFACEAIIQKSPYQSGTTFYELIDGGELAVGQRFARSDYFLNYEGYDTAHFTENVNRLILFNF